MIQRLALVVLAVVFIHIGGNAAVACGPAVEVRFFESDGDIFQISNKSEGPWALVSLVIRLTGSRGGLVFDTEDGGPGYSMHQQFVPVTGPGTDKVGLVGAEPVGDGAEEIRLLFSDFLPGREFMFIIDVDDRLESSDYGQAVVSGDEIEGARAEAVLTMPGGAKATPKASFGNDGVARLRGGACA